MIDAQISGLFELQRNFSRKIAQIPGFISSSLTAAGLKFEAEAKIRCPVDTGRLRASIGHGKEGIWNMKKNQLEIGTNVEYAAVQEFNEALSHRVGQAHYMRDALREVENQFPNIISKGLRDTFKL